MTGVNAERCKTTRSGRELEGSGCDSVSVIVPSTRHHCCVTGHASSGSEHTLGRPHAAHVFRRCLVAHQNAVVARSMLSLFQ